jgi:hypothetical protein
MASDRQRLLELALETLEHKRKELDLEIAQLMRQLRGRRGKAPALTASKDPGAVPGGKIRRIRFSKEERERRSARMKAYWDNWRKQKSREKK